MTARKQTISRSWKVSSGIHRSSDELQIQHGGLKSFTAGHAVGLDAVLDSLLEHVVYHDLDMRVTWANRAACQSARMTLDELVGRHCFRVWGCRDDPCEECPVLRARETGEPHAVEKQTPDGRLWYLQGFPIIDAGGNVVGMLELSLDITDRKRRAEEQLRSEVRYRTLIETIPYGIQQLDTNGTITFANSACNDTFGYGRDTLAGKSILDLEASDTAQRPLKENLSRWVAEQPKPEPFIQKMQTRQGKVIDVRVGWNYNRESDGQLSGFTLVVNDVTEKRIAERALQSARDKLEQRVQERTATLLETNRQLQNEIEERKRTVKALREQKDFFNTLLETISNPVFYKDATGRYTGCNKAFEDFTGRSRSEIVGKTVYDMGPKEIANRYYEKDRELFRNPGKQRYEWKVKSTTGGIRDVIFDKATFQDVDGHVSGLVGVISDITERKQTEEALKASEEKFRRIYEDIILGLFQSSTDGRLLNVNPAFARMFGFESPDQLIDATGDSAAKLYADPRDRMKLVRRILTSDAPIAAEVNFRKRDQSTFVGNMHGWNVIDTKRDALYLEGFIEDITERKMAETSLQESHKRLQFLSARLLSAQENEQRRLSLEIHDVMGQDLALLKMQLITISGRLRKDQQKLKDDIHRTLLVIDGIIEKARNLSRDLNPAIIEDLKLSGALSWLIHDIEQHVAVRISLDMAPVDHLFSTENQVVIYRIVQEALKNIVKHSRAATASVTIDKHTDVVRLLIIDDGTGFDISAVWEKHVADRGLGLAAMDERSRMLNSTFDIRSAPGKGTRLTFRIPITTEKGDI
ncbi:hypothetical protein D3OALGA1CA_4767 [Olavius algarvensis associated proteobacterium Delta 3]|nr:hypothetical protein D3OALGB2SA_2041 [Olavius algarvensis associated proteobacterium Delta 3]CAB5156579.1 hypothetical protein D3OALGA1CA_4767 [Olavius algarvensis associated proteobacterium Delta 3]